MDDTTKLDSLLAQLRYIQTGPFLTGVVHDMNNGIGAVIAYTELLGMGSHSREDMDKMLDDLLTAARRIADLNDALATLTRREVPKKLPVPIAPIVGQVALITEYRFRTHNIKLDIAIEGDLERTVACYRNEVARAMTYLLLNALENTEDAPQKEVYFVADIAADHLRITVRDTGREFGPGEFEKALEPYSTTKNPPHLGLGLTAVRSIAELHGGRLSYDPASGVTLRIPAEPS